MKNTSVNMTEGNILKNIIFFAIPILIGNIFQQLYNVVDTAIIGNILGDDALAAVGASAPVYGLMIGFASGLTNGFAVIIARYFGAQDERQMKKSVAFTYILAAVIAFFITVGSLVFLHPLMIMLKTPSGIIGDTESYMKVIMSFSVITIGYNMLAAMMRAIGNSRVPLYFLIISTVVNIFLDFLFVKGFHMGIPGAAFATVISQTVSVILCFIYIIKKCNFLLFRKNELEWDRSLLSLIVTTGLSMGLMNAIVSIGSVILQSAVNSFGTTTITAHTAARKIDDIFMLPLGTIALSSSTFASQNFGANKMDRVKKGIVYSVFVAMVWSGISLFIILFFRTQLILLLTGTKDVDVISISSRYIIWNIPFFFVLSILLVLRSSLQGVGRRIVPICGSIVEFALKILAVIFVAPKLGYFGICILEPVIWIICAIIVAIDFMYFRASIHS